MAFRKGLATIQIEPKTRDKIRELGKMGDTYDSVINMLIEFYKKRKAKK